MLNSFLRGFFVSGGITLATSLVAGSLVAVFSNTDIFQKFASGMLAGSLIGTYGAYVASNIQHNKRLKNDQSTRGYVTTLGSAGGSMSVIALSAFLIRNSFS